MKANISCQTAIAAWVTLGSVIAADRNASAPVSPPPGQYQVTWVGNSFSGASNRWVQNFFIHTKVQPDGTVNTWSHWDEGGKKFGVYKDGDVIGNTNVNPNSLETRDKPGRLWKLEVEYTDPKHQEWEFVPKGITCDGKPVTFPELFQPMALALANDGSLMVADSGTGPRQQVLFYDVDADARNQPEAGPRPSASAAASARARPGEITPDEVLGHPRPRHGRRRQPLRRHERAGFGAALLHPGRQAALGTARRVLLRRRRAPTLPTTRPPSGASRNATRWIGRSRPAATRSGSATRSTATSIRTTRAA